MTEKQLIFPMEEKYQEYLIDESKFSGAAESISFPENETEIVKILENLSEETPITIQGGKTGITGAAVPLEGHIINVSRMNKVTGHGTAADGSPYITVEPGINLLDLNLEINRRFGTARVFWPPQPTETSATAGGIAATGARGINSYYYGDTSQYISRLKAVLADGSIKEYKTPEEIGLFIGSEGIYGVMSELTLKLIPKPESVWGIAFFFAAKKDACGFAAAVSQIKQNDSAWIAAIEYLDRETITMIEARKSSMSKLKELPDINPEFQAMVYLELEGTEEQVEVLAETVMEAAVEWESDPEEAWAVSGENEMEKMKAFRHGAAETVNLFIEEQRRHDAGITKLGTDMQIEGQDVCQLISSYEQDAREAGVKLCIFGHIGDSHLHVNLLPQSGKEYKKGQELIRKWAVKAKRAGGTLICEHGIGKLKKQLLADLLEAETSTSLIRQKQKIDPQYKWNRGNIWGYPGLPSE